MGQFAEDDTGALERARAGLYKAGAVSPNSRAPFAPSAKRALPHQWQGSMSRTIPQLGKRYRRLARTFFVITFLFFLASLGIAGYFLYFGSNAVSVNKILIEVQGPITIVGGDTVPLSIAITNTNTVAIEDATIEIDFPNGTRNGEDVQSAYPRYAENIGTLASGAEVARSVRVVLFGGAGETMTLPVSLSYRTGTSNAVFVKKLSYALTVSSSPLSVSVDAPAEVVVGKPFTLSLTARSSAPVPLDNVVLSGVFPFGFSVTSSSLPLEGSSFFIGTLAPGAHKTVKLAGTILGQNNEQRIFRFTIGTAKTANDSTLAVTYLTQDATVALVAPFIDTTLALNGNTSDAVVVAPGSRQSVTVSYTNTLPTSVTNAVVAVALSGSAIDYDSIQVPRGFYRSIDRTVVFSQDADPSLATLAPGASGIGTFTFSTLPASALTPSPVITFTVSASGAGDGQVNSQGEMSASLVRTAKVSTVVTLSSAALHSSGPLSNTGPIPPLVDRVTTYTVVWDVHNSGSAVAGGTVSATLPGYVSYTGVTNGDISFTKDTNTVTWSVGNLAPGGNAQGAFQVSLIPSASQRDTAPIIARAASFSGYDRFAGVKVSASANPVTTDTPGDPGYVGANAVVQ